MAEETGKTTLDLAALKALRAKAAAEEPWAAENERLRMKRSWWWKGLMYVKLGEHCDAWTRIVGFRVGRWFIGGIKSE